MKTAHLSLGSNLGNRLGYLQKAVDLLDKHPDIKICKISSIYETVAWGLKEQDDFYNLVLEIKTTLPPKDLLQICQKIESELERTRDIHWGPRTIDIDILLYEKIEMEEECLTIPHKYLLERPFVTIPLAEITADLIVKGCNISLIAKTHKKMNEKCLKLPYEIKNNSLSSKNT